MKIIKENIPTEAPFTIGELEEIYPTASAYAKEHEEYREEALHATYLLQNGYPRIPCDLETYHGSVCGRSEEKLCKTECGI